MVYTTHCDICKGDVEEVQNQIDICMDCKNKIDTIKLWVNKDWDLKEKEYEEHVKFSRLGKYFTVGLFIGTAAIVLLEWAATGTFGF